MHIISANRLRILVLVIVVLIFWQIFRNWPSENEYKVRKIDGGFRSKICNHFYFMNITL